MHLAYVIAPGGGPEANVKTLAPELKKLGHRVTVVYTVGKDKVDAGWSDSVRFCFAPAASGHYYAARFVGSYHAWPLRLRAWEQARAVLRVLTEIEREEPIDIVEVTEGFSMANLSGYWPVIVRAHGSDWTFRRFCGDGEAKADDWLMSEQRKQLLGAQRTTALSTQLAEHLRDVLQLSSPIDVMPYGIDTTVFAPNSHAPVNPPVLLTVGRLERRKGVDVLLRAMPRVWQRFPDAQVRLIGNEGDLSRGDLLAMVPADNREQIVFPGFLERDQLVKEYQHATIYIAPTQYETFGYTVLEAMACGRPVISTQVGAIPELVDDGKTGLLVPWNDPTELAEAIIKLLDDPASAARMGAAGREKASNDFALETIVQRNLDSYQRALG
jgi:glycosyltransferase involved in cell wall biosynthesis